MCVCDIPPCHLLSILNDFQEIQYTFCDNTDQNITCKVWGSHSSTAKDSSLSVCILLIEWKTKFCSNILSAFENLHTTTDKVSQLTANRSILFDTQENLKNELKTQVQVEKTNYWPKNCESSLFFKYSEHIVTVPVPLNVL